MSGELLTPTVVSSLTPACFFEIACIENWIGVTHQKLLLWKLAIVMCATVFVSLGKYEGNLRHSTD